MTQQRLKERMGIFEMTRKLTQVKGKKTSAANDKCSREPMRMGVPSSFLSFHRHRRCHRFAILLVALIDSSSKSGRTKQRNQSRGEKKRGCINSRESKTGRLHTEKDISLFYSIVIENKAGCVAI